MLKRFNPWLLTGVLLCLLSGVSWASHPIQLEKATIGTGLGCYGACGHLKVAVTVENLVADKQVVVKYTVDGRSWYTGQAYYQETLDNNQERWFFEVNIPSRQSPVQLAVGMQANGTWYWDNNYGHNFLAKENFQRKPIQFISAERGRGLGCYGLCADFTVHVAVANLGYEKTVQMVYRLADSDQWYESSIGSYVGLLDDGRESWVLYLPYIYPKNRAIEFAVRYQVAGKIYWDNNNGENYLF
ncbi:carbohydrate-binding protein [Zooshikella ganghwensis]|nr:carbohydrate-binding protein [Zooshikella ganghwensis]